MGETAIATAPTKPVDYIGLANAFDLSQEVQIVAQETQQEIAELTKGKPLIIRSHIVEAEAQKLVIIIKQNIATAEAEHKAAKAPILEAGRIVDAKKNVFCATLAAGKELLERALKEWDNHQTEEARLAQEKLNLEAQKKQDKENERAAKKGVEPKQVAPAPVVQAPAKSTTVVVGGKSIVRTWIDNWKAKILGIPDTVPVCATQAQALGIPLDYFWLDRGQLNDLAKKAKCEDIMPGSKVVGWNDRYQR